MVVAWALSPLIIAMGLFLVGLVFHLLKSRRRLAFGFWIAGALILLAGSLPVLSYERNRAREYLYTPLPLDNMDTERPLAVIVLGTGFNPDPWLPGNSQVSPGFHARFLEGVRIFRHHPESKLIVSVANPEASRGEKEQFLTFMIELLALDKDRVVLISDAESTDDEARLARDLTEEGGQIVLATSAGHMPRAMEIFTKAGFEPVAAPCDFSHPREGSPNDKVWKRWIPSEGGVGATRQLLYETVALIWERVRG